MVLAMPLQIPLLQLTLSIRHPCIISTHSLTNKHEYTCARTYEHAQTCVNAKKRHALTNVPPGTPSSDSTTQESGGGGGGGVRSMLRGTSAVRGAPTVRESGMSACTCTCVSVFHIKDIMHT